MKKAFDQTVRELKREVNKKVLKVPGIEQKILDATSNEPWGPHGSLLADIAQATRNYHEYQIIMHVVWKRLNDTGKNWRHVYKALTVLEYLVGHGSERVVDEIREHAYQISTLSDFQYIDSSGKDQGNNVRRKSQSLVSLVNDKEKLQEVRQNALANKDKYRATFSSGGSHRSGSYLNIGGYGDRYDDNRYEGRYGSRDDDENGYGRERDSSYRDDDRYGRDGDFYRDGDQYGRDADERHGRYKDDDYRGRSNDDYQFGPRNKSSDKDRDNSFEDDDNFSYRNGGGRANEASPDERNLERKPSGQSLGAPPSYEAAVKNAPNLAQHEGDGDAGVAVVTKPLSPTAPQASSPQSSGQGSHHTVAGDHPSLSTDNAPFDEFDPRGSMPDYTKPAVSNASLAASAEVDLFQKPSSLDPVNSLALVLMTPTTKETDVKTNSDFGTNFVALSSASAAFSQPTEDPFGDAPFKAIPQENFSSHQHNSVNVVSASSFPSSAISTATVEHAPRLVPTVENSLSFDFGDSLGGLTYMPTANAPQYITTPTTAITEFPTTLGVHNAMNAHLRPPNMLTTNTGYVHTSPVFSSQEAEPVASPIVQIVNVDFLPHLGPLIPQAAPLPMQSVQSPAQMNTQAGPMNITQNSRLSPPVVTQKAIASSGPSNSKPSIEKFETKSTVWADTLNRGLVNLNISGSKINPLADIGIDLDSINRMERRKEKEKSVVNSVTSTVSLGKAMGSGSGIGRAGKGVLNPPRRPNVGPTMGIGMDLGMGMGMSGPGWPGEQGIGMGSYGVAMNQPTGVNMGMGPGGPILPLTAGMQRPPQGLTGVGYNSMIGFGGYGTQQSYGGGYR